MQQGVRIGRATGNVNVHGDDGVDAPNRGVVDAEDAAAAATRPYGHDQARVGHSIVGFFKGKFHVARDWAGDEQHIGVAGRGNKVNAEPFEVIDRAGEPDNFDFAAIAGAGVDFADVQGAAEEFGGPIFDVVPDELEGVGLRLVGAWERGSVRAS